jgi:hypothetical protein
MLAYFLRRAVWGVATILGVLLFLFVLFFLVTEPQDVARRALGEKAPPEAIAQWLTNHDYDKPAVWNPEDPLDTRLRQRPRGQPGGRGPPRACRALRGLARAPSRGPAGCRRR